MLCLFKRLKFCLIKCDNYQKNKFTVVMLIESSLCSKPCWKACDKYLCFARKQPCQIVRSYDYPQFDNGACRWFIYSVAHNLVVVDSAARTQAACQQSMWCQAPVSSPLPMGSVERTSLFNIHWVLPLAFKSENAYVKEYIFHPASLSI